MGTGYFSEEKYVSHSALRASTGRKDFEYTESATRVHELLDTSRIKDKATGMLESRDSVEHPESTPVIITFDVTGSNRSNAIVAQKKLPELMAKLADVCDGPQVSIWANDDYCSVGRNAIQISEFESDNRIDEAIRSVWLTGAGGSNDGESYDLLIYAAARKTVTDSMEKRGKKGYMFLYADEPFFDHVSARQVHEVFGDGLQANIPIASIITEAQAKWDIYVVWPQNGYKHARAQYVELFGADRVVDLQSPEMLCDKVASIVAQSEEVMDLVGVAATADMDDDLHSRLV